MQKIYSYDAASGEYTSEYDAQIDPLETEKSGKNIYLIPAFSTMDAPPAAQADKVSVRVGESWNAKEDHRGKTVYKQSDKAVLEISDIGPLPDGYTEAIPSEFDSWAGSTWVTDAAAELYATKVPKLVTINAAAEAAIVSGFASSALGTAHTYQSDRDDQLNLVGMVVAGSDDYFKCTDANGVAGYKLHTIEQLKQVLSDGKVVKLTALQHAGVLKAEVAAAGTVEQVNAIEVSF